MNTNKKNQSGRAILLVSIFVFAVSCQSQNGSSLSGSGTVEVREVNIAPLLSARISKIYFDEGDSVQAGDLLVSLSSNEAAADVAGMHARLRSARNAVEQAAATVRDARTNLSRSRELFSSGALSQQKLDEAKTRADVSEAALSSARSQVNEIQAMIDKAESRFSETKIVSPLSGTVLTVNFEEGEVVMPGNKILTVGDLSFPELTIYLSATQIARVKTGATARIKVDGIDKDFSGKVVRIHDEAEFTPKNVQTSDARARLVYGVKIALPADGVFRPGMMADATIIPEK